MYLSLNIRSIEIDFYGQVSFIEIEAMELVRV